MTKKRNIPHNIPQLLPNKKKELLKLCNNPQAIQRIIQMNKTALQVLEKKETARSLTVADWAERAFQILPIDLNKPENLEKLKNLFNMEYTDDARDERKDCNNE